MADRRALDRPSGPISLAVTADQRRRLAAEARRRGLGVSPTIRTLALERLAEIEEEGQLARAEKWQLERVRELVDEIARGGKRHSVSRREIDAIFDEATRQAGARRKEDARAG